MNNANRACDYNPDTDHFLGSADKLKNRKVVYIDFFDTTLRDGEQAEGSAMTMDQKMLFADMSAKAGVKIHEVGFPGSNDDSDNVKAVSKALKHHKNTEVCALSRCNKEDIDKTYKALSKANRKRIHIFLATSDIHLTKKLKKTRLQAMKMIRSAVSYAKQNCSHTTIEFSPEDATRTEIKDLITAVRTAIRAGANVINIPDTVGNVNPWQIEWMFNQLIKNTNDLKENHDFKFSFHGHNDEGLGVANALAAIRGGARQVEACWGDNGERTGNFPIEEVALAIDMQGARMHPDFIFKHRLKRELIIPTTMAIYEIMGKQIPDSKVLIGRRVALHGAGIHTDGSVKDGGVFGDQSTYNAIDVAKYGGTIPEQPVGSRAGGADIVKALKNFGINKKKKDVSGILRGISEKAVDSKRIFPAHILYEYSKAHENMSEVRIKSTKRDMLVSFSFGGRQYEIRDKIYSDNGEIQALTHGIKDFCGKNIDIFDQSEAKQYSIEEIRHNYNQRVRMHVPNHHLKGAGAMGISRVLVGNGDRRYNVHLAGHDVQMTNLTAIFIASWPFIREKIRKSDL
jgi:2-isopropylmalate synthase